MNGEAKELTVTSRLDSPTLLALDPVRDPIRSDAQFQSLATRK
jgi:hypothetical protein